MAAIRTAVLRVVSLFASFLLLGMTLAGCSADPAGVEEGAAASTATVTANASGGKTSLVFGTGDPQANEDEIANATRGLELAGHDAESSVNLPEDLSPYATIWHVSAYTALTSDEIDRLHAFVEDGGSLYLTGERPCCEELNQSVERLVNGLITTTDVGVGGLGDIGGPYTFNPGAAGDIVRFPNLLTDFIPSAPGGLSGLSNLFGRNVFAASATTPVGGVWTEEDLVGGRGRLVLLMDVNWLGLSTWRPLFENIQNFLDEGAGCTNDGHWDGFAWTGPQPTNSPSNCSTISAPVRVEWSAGSDDGPVTIDVVGNGVTPTCGYVSGPAAASRISCEIPVPADRGSSVTVTATDSRGTSTRRYRVEGKNDPRNVPSPFSFDSNWWDWPDRDEDGLPDNWETNGVWVEGDLVDLRGMGADPNRKDLFVRYDYEESRPLSDQFFAYLRDAYSKAPLLNADGSSGGIVFHTVSGQSVPSSVIGKWTGSVADYERVMLYTGFANSPLAGGGGVPQLIKYYVNIAGPLYKADGTVDGNVIGTAFVKGNVGWIGLHGQSENRFVSALDTKKWFGDAADWVRACNAFHELGHNLGIRHHGASDKPERDPKYKSVMSYSYNTVGVPSGLFGLGNKIDLSRENSVNYDFNLGKEVGKLTFVPGQWGEIPDLYSIYGQGRLYLGPDGAQEVEAPIEQMIAEADPAAIAEFDAMFDLEAANHSPVVSDVAAATPAGTAVTVPLGGSDPDGDAVSLRIDSPPSHGTAEIVAGSLRYVPEPGFTGDDQLTFRASDGYLSSAEATVRITVTGSGGSGETTLAVTVDGRRPVVAEGPVPSTSFAVDINPDGLIDSVVGSSTIPRADGGDVTVDVTVTRTFLWLFGHVTVTDGATGNVTTGLVLFAPITATQGEGIELVARGLSFYRWTPVPFTIAVSIT